jgi:hypothetical protein
LLFWQRRPEPEHPRRWPHRNKKKPEKPIAFLLEKRKRKERERKKRERKRREEERGGKDGETEEREVVDRVGRGAKSAAKAEAKAGGVLCTPA